MSNAMRVIVIALCSTFMLSLSTLSFAAHDAYSRSVIKKRIAPVGEVKLAGEESPTSATADANKQADAAPKKETLASGGETVYKSSCVACHASGLAGAPKFRVKANWQARQKKGIDTLVQSVVKGMGAMPPKGTCSTCTDAQIKQAIEYMLPK